MKPLVLSIKFTTTPGNKEEFKNMLVDLFHAISEEPTFISAVLHEGIQQPNDILVYETWDETVENFLTVQMTKPYRIPYEEALTKLKVTREPAVYTPFARWGADGYHGK